MKKINLIVLLKAERLIIIKQKEIAFGFTMKVTGDVGRSILGLSHYDLQACVWFKMYSTNEKIIEPLQNRCDILDVPTKKRRKKKGCSIFIYDFCLLGHTLH